MEQGKLVQSRREKNEKGPKKEMKNHNIRQKHILFFFSFFPLFLENPKEKFLGEVKDMFWV